MTTRTETGARWGTRSDFAREIRNTLDRLEELNRETAGYLKTLAFILHRVAIADKEVSVEETERMEQILVDHASLSRSEAVLTVEIARHCGEIADCGCRYEASRNFRSSLDEKSGRDIRGFLESVAEADGRVRVSEKAQIEQIAAELGLRNQI
jgi:uncharacterized tellurite resistance protein B-like protein